MQKQKVELLHSRPAKLIEQILQTSLTALSYYWFYLFRLYTFHHARPVARSTAAFTTMSTLPPSAANAARNAINAVNAEFARKDVQLDDGDGQELTLEDRPEEEMRTVFNDPTTFNVKVRILSLSFTTISVASL